MIAYYIDTSDGSIIWQTSLDLHVNFQEGIQVEEMNGFYMISSTLTKDSSVVFSKAGEVIKTFLGYSKNPIVELVFSKQGVIEIRKVKQDIESSTFLITLFDFEGDERWSIEKVTSSSYDCFVSDVSVYEDIFLVSLNQTDCDDKEYLRYGIVSSYSLTDGSVLWEAEKEGVNYYADIIDDFLILVSHHNSYHSKAELSSVSVDKIRLLDGVSLWEKWFNQHFLVGGIRNDNPVLEGDTILLHSQIVTKNLSQITAIDVETGEELWYRNNEEQYGFPFQINSQNHVLVESTSTMDKIINLVSGDVLKNSPSLMISSVANVKKVLSDNYFVLREYVSHQGVADFVHVSRLTAQGQQFKYYLPASFCVGNNTPYDRRDPFLYVDEDRGLLFFSIMTSDAKPLDDNNELTRNCDPDEELTSFIIVASLEDGTLQGWASYTQSLEVHGGYVYEVGKQWVRKIN